MNSDVKVGRKVRILHAVGGPFGVFPESREIEGRWLDVVTVTEENALWIEEQLRGGHADFIGTDKRRDLADIDILPDSPKGGTRSNRRYFKAKRSR
jgi:hypothetical protein